MLLAIDIGNTNITLGMFRFEGQKSEKGPVNIWRLATSRNMTEDEYGSKLLDLFHYSMLELSDLKVVACASVVPGLTGLFESAVKKYLKNKMFVVSHETAKKVNILYNDPAEVGADRIANAAAAYHFYGGPVIVIDFGTATTFDCISKRGEYVGGVIAPGPGISSESLARRTARLPMVEIAKPVRVIGRSTVGGIQSGLYYGYVGLVKEILSNIKVEMRSKPVIIATGGLAGLIAGAVKDVKAVVPELTLEGIRLIWEASRR
ncbi:MAG: type III pantothenate kinase [Endomicrobiales bacterium]|nr:type III pantothenate kinase [Endomicrobiales bacterium]